MNAQRKKEKLERKWNEMKETYERMTDGASEHEREIEKKE